MTFALPRRYAEEILAHAQEEAPNECCGLLGGKDGVVLGLFRARNAEASPYRYRVHSDDLIGIINELDRRGWELLGIYHSHTRAAAYPSASDVQLAAYPDAVHLILSLQEEAQPTLRAFYIRGGQVQEEELLIAEEEAPPEVVYQPLNVILSPS